MQLMAFVLLASSLLSEESLAIHEPLQPDQIKIDFNTAELRHTVAPDILNTIYSTLDEGFTTWEDISAHKSCIHEEGEEIDPENIPKELNKKDFDAHKYGSSITYGEVLADDLFSLTTNSLKTLDLNETGVMWDIGSGTGKVVLQQFLERDFQRVVGIELVERRWNISVQALKNLREAANHENSSIAEFLIERMGTDKPKLEMSYTDLKGKPVKVKAACLSGPKRSVCLVNGDIMEAGLQVDPPMFAYTCAQCLPPSVLKKMTTEVLASFPTGAGLASLAKLPEEEATQSALEYKGELKEHIYRYNTPASTKTEKGNMKEIWVYRHGELDKQLSPAADKKDPKANVHLYSSL